MGTILLWAGTWVPTDWMICAGQSIQVSQNQAL
jgi:microcystin-dependent protein